MFRIPRCICKRCACISECEYYKETVQPVLNIVEADVFCDDGFVNKLANVLEEFECEYFEER